VVRSVARSTEHAETPSVAHVDVLGRPFRTVETPDGTEEYVTDTVLDLLGRTTAVIDARGNTTQADVFDAVGRSVHSTSPDAGETRILLDVAGQPVRTWKSGGIVITQTYDALRRPRATLDGTRVHVFNVYGEFDDTDHARGRLWRQYDGAGLVELGYDFAGNGISSTRTFLDDVDTEVNWLTLLDDADVATLDTTAAGALQGSGFTTTTTFDALKRVITSTTPDDSVTRNTWDEGGRLSAIDVQIRGSSTWTPMVGAITHDAKGQRTRIEYPGFATDYTYDPETFRLVRLETVRDSDDAVLQDLTYTYDAAGNIVQISDAAQQTLFFDNSVVSPTTKYKYDALYRLLSAEGREHGSLAQPAHGDPALGDLPHDNDGSAVRTYLETYLYDEVGNILRMKHQGGTEASPGSVLWHRGYHYATGSNVLLKTSLPGDDVEDPDTYSATAYDVNDRGALVEMPHLAGITRQFDDQMRGIDLGSGDDAVYHYDAAGQRVRKVVRTGATTKERLYVGAWERFQRSTTTLQEERETLHVMDDRRRIVMIETLTVDSGTAVSTPVPRQRFQLGNHLESAALEVDEDGALITYEEYHPYGTTAWWASNGSTDVSQKRYRYTGKEKDEETGLAYHGARYYAAWLGRWDRVDPSGLRDGPNRFSYARNNPIRYSDTTGNASEESWTVSGFFSAWGDAASGGAKAFGAAVKANIGNPLQAAIKDPIGTASAIASATPTAAAIRVGSEYGFVAGMAEGAIAGVGLTAGAAYEFGASVARSPLAPVRAYQAGQEVKAGVAAGDPARAQAGVEGIGRALTDTANAAGVITGALGVAGKAGAVAGRLGLAAGEAEGAVGATIASPMAAAGEAGTGAALTARQAGLLEALSESMSSITIPKSGVSLGDLAALTKATGDEFGMFTLAGRRAVYRGTATNLGLAEEQIVKHALEGWRFSGHTHPGVTSAATMASGGDRLALQLFEEMGTQGRSVVLNSAGEFRTFTGDLFTDMFRW
jgi:RHS repeat-associated protein